VSADEEADGHHERRDVGHHNKVAVHRACVAHAAAGTEPIANWAAKNNIKKSTLVADFGQHRRRDAFKKTFTAAGGQIVGEVRVPVRNPTSRRSCRRSRTRSPRPFHVHATGIGDVAFMKGFVDRGLGQAGIKIIATGDLTDEDIIEAYGDSALGVINSFHYSEAHNSPRTRRSPTPMRRPTRKTARTSWPSPAMTGWP
jgi:hypothetical protein